MKHKPANSSLRRLMPLKQTGRRGFWFSTGQHGCSRMIKDDASAKPAGLFNDPEKEQQNLTHETKRLHHRHFAVSCGGGGRIIRSCALISTVIPFMKIWSHFCSVIKSYLRSPT
jgi:hypothetical protein